MAAISEFVRHEGDPDIPELRRLARRKRVDVRIDPGARLMKKPYVWLRAKDHPQKLKLGEFASARAAIDWLGGSCAAG